MYAFAQVAVLAARIMNDECLFQLPSFYQFDLFDACETIMTTQQVNKDVLYAGLAALVTKYTQAETLCKRNSRNVVVAPLLSPLVLDATGVDTSLMLEIATVIAVVSE